MVSARVSACGPTARAVEPPPPCIEVICSYLAQCAALCYQHRRVYHPPPAGGPCCGGSLITRNHCNLRTLTTANRKRTRAATNNGSKQRLHGTSTNSGSKHRRWTATARSSNTQNTAPNEGYVQTRSSSEHNKSMYKLALDSYTIVEATIQPTGSL